MAEAKYGESRITCTYKVGTGMQLVLISDIISFFGNIIYLIEHRVFALGEGGTDPRVRDLGQVYFACPCP